MQYKIISVVENDLSFFKTILCNQTHCKGRDGMCVNTTCSEENIVVIIDLKRVSIVTSLFFAELLWCKSRGNSVVLVNLNDRIQAIFDLLNIGQVIKTAPNVEAVLNNLDSYYDFSLRK